MHSSVLLVTPIRSARFRERRGPSGYGRVVIGGRAFLPASVRRRTARTLSSSRLLLRDVRHIVSEDSTITAAFAFAILVFPADCPHPSHCHRSLARTGSAGYTDVPAYSRMLAPLSPVERATLNMLPFGRRSPQSNCPLSTVPVATNNKLEFKHSKGGVSSSAPRVPKYAVHSLPPTLRMLGLNPIPSCS